MVVVVGVQRVDPVRAALRASDGILLVVSAESGVEMDTERAWGYGVELQLPRMVYVNKMDMENADFFGTLETMRDVFGKSIMPLQIPIGEGPDFRGIIDLITMKAEVYDDALGKEIEVVDIPEDELEEAKKYHKTSVGGQALIEGIMMRGPKGSAMAVRLPNGEIETKYKNVKPWRDKCKFFGVPLIRGIVGFVESLVTG